MAEEASKDAAAKARIMKHLNADHQLSLSYYLQHYNSLSSLEARKPTLIDITFNSMTLKTYGGISTIPLYPPMTSWSEARIRTVEMDRASRAALDISPFHLTTYIPPTAPSHVIIVGLVILAFVSFLTYPWIVPGTFVYDTILPWFPGGPEWYIWLTRMTALPTVAIHLVETVMLDRRKLRKYGVERGSAVWWKWVASCFLEGVGCFQRIDTWAAQKEKEAEKASH